MSEREDEFVSGEREETCKHCRFYAQPHPDDETGTCQIRAPLSHSHRWPLVFMDDWCGEWDEVHGPADGLAPHE